MTGVETQTEVKGGWGLETILGSGDSTKLKILWGVVVKGTYEPGRSFGLDGVGGPGRLLVGREVGPEEGRAILWLSFSPAQSGLGRQREESSRAV